MPSGGLNSRIVSSALAGLGKIFWHVEKMTPAEQIMALIAFCPNRLGSMVRAAKYESKGCLNEQRSSRHLYAIG